MRITRARRPLLGRALAQGFAFQGELMAYRGAARGEPSGAFAAGRLCRFLQNHDQVGNRAFGERIAMLATARAVRAATAVYLLLPQIPMLFMGEEWHARQPFLFFCDFGAELGQAVARGRRQEFARFAAFQDESARERIPDPQAPETFMPASWTGQRSISRKRPSVFAWYRELLSVRRRHIVPLLPALARGGSVEHRLGARGGARTLAGGWRAPELIAAGESEGRAGRRHRSTGGKPAVAGGTRRCRRTSGSVERALEPARVSAYGMIPRATYRLQLHKGFGFDAVAQCAPYLAALGVSHAYLSPYLKARPGSSHGYDIVDHARAQSRSSATTPRSGEMATALRSHDLGHILDFVPNHMGVGGADNPLWLDVLEWGPDAAHAGWFDIEWDPQRRYLHNKLLVPLLGDHYGIELERGMLRAASTTSRTAVSRSGPTAPTSCRSPRPTTPRILGNEHAELERLADAFAWLPNWRLQMARRAAEFKAAAGGSGASEHADVREALSAALARFQGRPGRAQAGANWMP